MAIGEGGDIDQPVKKNTAIQLFTQCIWSTLSTTMVKFESGMNPQAILHIDDLLWKSTCWKWEKKILFKKEEERTKQTLMFFVAKGHSWVWSKTPALPRLQPYSFSHYPELVTIVEGGNVKTNEWLWFQAQLSLHHKRLGYTHPL